MLQSAHASERAALEVLLPNGFLASSEAEPLKVLSPTKSPFEGSSDLHPKFRIPSWKDHRKSSATDTDFESTSRKDQTGQTERRASSWRVTGVDGTERPGDERKRSTKGRPHVCRSFGR